MHDKHLNHSGHTEVHTGQLSSAEVAVIECEENASVATWSSVMQLPDYLIRASDGEILLSGHRIGLFHVLDRYIDGYSPEMLAGQYPSLSLALIHKTIALYLENRAEIDAYVAEYAAALKSARSSDDARHLDVVALRA